MSVSSRNIARVSILAMTVGIGSTAEAQWTNRYPRVAGYGHQIYLEGYELPMLTSGPIDAVESKNGSVAFASFGYLWSLDQRTNVATRITRSAGVDSRPAWSPDGSMLAFLRDDSQRLRIVLLDVRARTETLLVTDSAMVLDPAFSADGKSVFYSSSVAGDLDLWQINLATKARTRVTDQQGTAELHPMPTPDGQALLYLSKTRAGNDIVRRRSLATGEDRALYTGAIVSIARGAVSPDSRTLALSWPSQQDRWELRLVNAVSTSTSVELFHDAATIPLTPAWNVNGSALWFSRADAKQRMHLSRIGTGGGAAVDVPIRSWRWETPMARVRIVTRMAASAAPVSARVAVRTADGHPVVADGSQMRFDGQNGIAFFYSNGTSEITVPAGDIEITAVQGLTTPPASQRVTVREGETKTVVITMTPVWNAAAKGWLSGEHHFHLNYGGPYRLEPGALITMGRAENLDVMTPMLANLATRFDDQTLFTYQNQNAKPWISWAQEVRSHFLGHVGIIGAKSLFWPWIWGPGYDVYSRDDRPNADVMDWAKERDAFNVYVHPVSSATPFENDATLRTIPIGFVADAVTGRANAIELVCLWSDERGSQELWYRILNVGVPMVLSAGTDVMNNLYRTMAVGTTRVYVRPERPSQPESYFAGLRAGRSFVTNGPMLQFSMDGKGPGEVVKQHGMTQPYDLMISSAVPVDSVEIVVNGVVYVRLPGFSAPGSRRYTGVVRVPNGGWVAARASGPATRAWPAMDSYAFAHTAPIWINRVGSVDAGSRMIAARELLRALDVSDRAIEIGYAGADHPRILAHNAAARRQLNEWLAKP